MAFTIYDLLFEKVELEQVELLVVVLCGASWLCVLFLGTIPRILGNIHSFPLHYTSLTWCHPSPTQQHYLCPQRFLFLGIVPLISQRNFPLLHPQHDAHSASQPWLDPCHSLRPQRDPCHSSHPRRNPWHT